MMHSDVMRSGRLLPVLILLLALAAPALAADEKPLAVIDSQRIMEEYDAARDAQEQYQKFLRELEREVADKEKALSALMEEIESQKMLLGEDALKAKVDQFEQRKAEYFQFRETIEQRAESEYKAKVQPIMDQITTIVERLGKEKKVGMIVDAASLVVVYVDPDYDLTNDVLAALVRGDD
jgi:outer membrane protein